MATDRRRGMSQTSGVSAVINNLLEPIDWSSEVRRWKAFGSLRFSRASPQMKIYVVISFVFYISIFCIYYKYNGGIVPYFLRSDGKELRSDMFVLDHYPHLQNDASRIQFACSANTKEQLLYALKGNMHILEGDIMLRGQGTNQQVMLPVMAKHPETDGPLTFQEWIETAKEGGKAIKLDFQSIDAVDLSLQVLGNYDKALKFPVWLSGEILPGPNSVQPPLDPNLFLRLCSTTFPLSTLVLGWRTGPFLKGLPNVYTWAMVREMHTLIKKWKIEQPIVFSVKGPFAKRSIHQLKWLMEMTDSSMVVYNEHKDGIAAADIMAIKYRLPEHKVFIDLDDDLQGHVDSLKMSQPLMQHNSRLNTSFQIEQWVIIKQGDLYFSSESILFQQSVFLSKDLFHPTSSLATVVEALVEFVPPYLDYAKKAEEQDEEEELGLEIYLRVTKGARHTAMSGVRCFIGSEGTLSISSSNVPGSDALAEAKWQEMPVCVKVIITDLGTDKISMEVFQLQDCYVSSPKPQTRKYLTLDTRSISATEGAIAIKGKGKSGYIAITSFQILHVSSHSPE